MGSPHGISGHRAHTQCEVSQEPAASLGPGSQKPWVRCQLGQSRGRRLQFTASQAELGTGNLGALFEQTWWIGSPWLLQTGQSPFDPPLSPDLMISQEKPEIICGCEISFSVLALFDFILFSYLGFVGQIKQM